MDFDLNEEAVHVLPINFEYRIVYPRLSRDDFNILRNAPQAIRDAVAAGFGDEVITTNRDLMPAYFAYFNGDIRRK
jgi:hypothetical protein